MVLSNDGTATFYEDYVMPSELYFESTLYDIERAVVEAIDFEEEQAELAKTEQAIDEEVYTEYEAMVTNDEQDALLRKLEAYEHGS